MGITIHYRGRIDNIEDVDRLSSEIKEFADILDWDIKEWNENWHLPNSAALQKEGDRLKISGHVPIRGVSVIPHADCEPLFLTFNKDGTLASSINMVMMADDGIETDRVWLSTKTQFASAEIHASLIKLLRFVKSKYISNLEVHDDGRFWASEDMTMLKKLFARVETAINSLPESLNLITKKELQDRTPEEIADFIEDIIRKKFGK